MAHTSALRDPRVVAAVDRRPPFTEAGQDDAIDARVREAWPGDLEAAVPKARADAGAEPCLPISAGGCRL